jgi:NAD(P)-dependent dehydrogenase (short-subunit alcohol dehydrogenase family)
MDLELKDKVYLVSGGAKGIGAGIMERLAAEGAFALAVGRSPEAGEALVEHIRNGGGKAEFYPLEMTDEAAVQATVQTILDQHGRIDGVVNNAGRNDAVSLRHGVDAFERSLRNNLVQIFSLTHHCLDALIASQGVVINIGSKCSLTGQGGTSGYAASKGGMNALTREWALDLAKYGIRVNCVIPAEVITPLYEAWLAKTSEPAEARRQLNATIPFGRRTTTIEEIADMVAFIASPRSSHTTGQILHVDGGYVHLDRACTMDTSHLESS